MNIDVVLKNKSGQLHCDNGPALVTERGDLHFFINGKRSRLDGPAIVWYDNEESYYIDGVKYEKHHYADKIKMIKNG